MDALSILMFIWVHLSALLNPILLNNKRSLSLSHLHTFQPTWCIYRWNIHIAWQIDEINFVPYSHVLLKCSNSRNHFSWDLRYYYYDEAHHHHHHHAHPSHMILRHIHSRKKQQKHHHHDNYIFNCPHS
jgi:hypothetical protein